YRSHNCRPSWALVTKNSLFPESGGREVMNAVLSPRIAAPVCLLIVSVHLSLLFGQGALNPPGGPTPTMKSLDQIEPRIDLLSAPASAVTTSDSNYHYIITQPGSYYLTANIAVTK